MTNRGFFWFFSMYCIQQHCFICRHSDSTVSEDAGTEPRTVATSAGSNHSARSHPLFQCQLYYVRKIARSSFVHRRISQVTEKLNPRPIWQFFELCMIFLYEKSSATILLNWWSQAGVAMKDNLKNLPQTLCLWKRSTSKSQHICAGRSSHSHCERGNNQDSIVLMTYFDLKACPCSFPTKDHGGRLF